MLTLIKDLGVFPVKREGDLTSSFRFFEAPSMCEVSLRYSCLDTHRLIEAYELCSYVVPIYGDRDRWRLLFYREFNTYIRGYIESEELHLVKCDDFLKNFLDKHVINHPKNG